MPVEKGLVVGHVLVTDKRLTLPEFDHPVDQQKRVAVRKMLQNVVDIHNLVARIIGFFVFGPGLDRL